MSPKPVFRTVLVAVTGVAAVSLVGAAVWADVTVDRSAPETTASQPVALPASQWQGACAGPPESITEELSAADPDADVGETTTYTALTAVTLARDNGDSPPEASVDLHDDGVQTIEPGAGPVATYTADELDDFATLSIEPDGDMTGLGAGVSASRTDAGDLRGLTATACREAETVTWLVGGSSETGTSSRLQLANPTAVPAEVNIEVWTGLGEADAPGLLGVVVPPHSTEDVLVESEVTDPSLAYRIESSGGLVTATLQDQRIPGLVSGGLDIIGAGQSPSRSTVIPAMTVVEEETTELRLANPSQDQAASATITLMGTDGTVEVPGGDDVEVAPGVVTDVDMSAVSPGVYGIHVEADQPLAAAAMTTRTGEAGPDGTPQDIAWSSSTPPLSRGVLAMADDELVDETVVIVSNPSDEAADISLISYDDEGEAGSQDVTIPADSRITHLVEAGSTAVELVAEDTAVHATAMVSAQAPDGQLLAFQAINADPHADREIDVNLR